MNPCIRVLAQSFTVVALNFAAGTVQSQSAGEALNERTQLEFCATYIPCKIAVEIMDTAATAVSVRQRIKAFFEGLGRTPAKSQAEFNAFVLSQSPSWRKERVEDCIQRRGSATYREYCEEAFLSPEELRATREGKVTKRSSMDASDAKQKRKDLLNIDNNIGTGLSLNCSPARVDTSYCAQVISDFSVLRRDADALNSNPDYLKHFAPIELRSEPIALLTHEFDGNNWVRKKSDVRAREELIGSCDAIRRDLSTSMDDNQFTQANALASQLISRCSTVSDLYLGLATSAQQRISAALTQEKSLQDKQKQEEAEKQKEGEIQKAQTPPDGAATPLRRQPAAADATYAAALTSAIEAAPEAQRVQAEQERNRTAKSQQLFAQDLAERRQREEQARAAAQRAAEQREREIAVAAEQSKREQEAQQANSGRATASSSDRPSSGSQGGADLKHKFYGCVPDERLLTEAARADEKLNVGTPSHHSPSEARANALSILDDMPYRMRSKTLEQIWLERTSLVFGWQQDPSPDIIVKVRLATDTLIADLAACMIKKAGRSLPPAPARPQPIQAQSRQIQSAPTPAAPRTTGDCNFGLRSPSGHCAAR